MIYGACKKVIESGNYEYNSMMIKLDIYLLGNRITPTEYNELVGMMVAPE